MIGLLITLAFWLVPALVAWHLAGKKNRSKVGWAFLSLLGPLLVLLVLIFLPALVPAKKCPACSRLVKVEADVCPHCRREFPVGLYDGKLVMIPDPDLETKGVSGLLILVIVLPLLFVFVAIVGILAAIAIPKFADLVAKSKEAATIGSLQSLRASLEVYKEGHKSYPTRLEDAWTMKQSFPAAQVKGHAGPGGVENFSNPVGDDAGGWGYVNVSTSPAFGRVFVNCTHTDTKGRRWDTE